MGFPLVYGRFLIISTARTAPMMIMTMMMATPIISTVEVDAKPVGGEAAGAIVAPGAPAMMCVSAHDP